MNLTSTNPERGPLAARKYGNSVPVGGASLVASPHRSDYPSYAPEYGTVIIWTDCLRLFVVVYNLYC